MNSTLLIVLAEVIFILTLVLLTMIFVGWKQKKSKNTAFEQLLNQVTEQEGSRKALLIEYLTGHQRMDNQAALELSEDFFAAEKEFMYLFLDQQVKQQPLSGFYENLCDLLDKYLDILPEASELNGVDQLLSGPEQEKEAGDVENEDDVLDSPEEEPDWGAEFSEFGDEMDESVRKGYDAENGNDGQ